MPRTGAWELAPVSISAAAHQTVPLSALPPINGGQNWFDAGLEGARLR